MLWYNSKSALISLWLIIIDIFLRLFFNYLWFINLLNYPAIVAAFYIFLYLSIRALPGFIVGFFYAVLTKRTLDSTTRTQAAYIYSFVAFLLTSIYIELGNTKYTLWSYYNGLSYTLWGKIIDSVLMGLTIIFFASLTAIFLLLGQELYKIIYKKI